MADDEAAKSKKLPMLEPFTRWVLGLVGVALLIVGVAMALFPPSRSAFAPQCGADQPAAECVAEIDGDVTALSAAVTGAGLVMVLVGCNGIRISTVELPGGTGVTMVKEAEETLNSVDQKELSDDADPTDPAPEELIPLTAPAAHARLAAGDFSIFEPKDVPSKVVSDLLLNPPTERPRVAATEIRFAARRPNQGNHPWLVGLDDGSVVKVSYGGQGKNTPTVNLVEGPSS